MPKKNEKKTQIVKAEPFLMCLACGMPKTDHSEEELNAGCKR